jgi:predicted RecB family nuclease
MMDEEEVTEVLADIEDRLDDLHDMYGPDMMVFLMEEMAGFYQWVAGEQEADEYVEAEFEKIIKREKWDDE